MSFFSVEKIKLANSLTTKTVSFQEPSSYSFVYIDLFFRRRTLFYTFNYVIPNFIITILSITGFILPPESGEKISLRKRFLL